MYVSHKIVATIEEGERRRSAEGRLLPEGRKNEEGDYTRERGGAVVRGVRE